MLAIDRIQVDSIGFQEAVYTVTRLIPRGKVLGYGHVAALIGRPRHARHVGNALKSLPLNSDVPWWRVLRSDGSIAMQGDILRGPLQLEHLDTEKVGFLGQKVNMRTCRWIPEIT